MKSIQDALFQERQVVQDFVAILKEKIGSLDNIPKVQRLGDNCLSVRSNVLDGNWSAFHHDHEAQYAQIIKSVQNQTSVGAIVRVIDGILGSGSYVESQRNQYKFSELVLNNLRKIWSELDAEQPQKRA